MKDRAAQEFLEERLAATQAEAENYQMQADTALKYAEQVWWSWDLKRQRLKVRAVGECILGYGFEDLDHGDQFWWDRIHPDDQKEVEQSLQDCFESKERIWKCEHRLRDVSGDWVWVEQAGFVHQSDADGNPVEMVGITRKTQERYQLLDLFRGSQTLIEALSEAAPIAFWIRDGEGRVLLSSKTMKESFGIPEKYDNAEQLTRPQSRRKWQDAFQSALQDTGSKREMVMLLKDGDEKRHEHHLIPLTQGKHTFAVLEVFIPI